MCGIAGFINLDSQPISPALLKKATDAITHRGPDAEGHWIEGNIGLGHRRLSIIDLSPAGQQPMISSDDRYVLTYNGEVYNYRELRAALKSEGFRFRGQSDSEVVLSALSFWGKEALLKFNGMFAFALWDRQEKRLLLARDRYGIKPLYYSKQNNVFSFGSEQKAILANSEFVQSINHAALLEYFTFQNIFTDQTLVSDIFMLPAGHFIDIDINDSSNIKIKPTQYWDYHFKEPEITIEKREYQEELDRLFRQAVNRQLVSDVELGSYLSGGMDSGSITALAAMQFPFVKTFTCGFDLSTASGVELAFDERMKAAAMSSLFETEHYETVLKAVDMERCLPKLAWHLEEPRVGQSYPNYYAAKLASKFVKVVLSGTGGDELFGGYPWRYFRTVNSKNFEEYVDEYYIYWQRLVSNSELKELFAPIWNEVKDVWTRDIFRDVFLSHKNELTKPEDYINHSLYFEAKTFLHGLFVVEDKLSMAHSLENRVPFMDNDLVDFAMSCPISMKLNNLSKVVKINENDPVNKKRAYFQKTSDGKQILRDMMKFYIPEEITKAQKQGFSAPDASWFRGESKQFVKSKLQNSDSNLYNVLDYKATNKLIQEHLDDNTNRRLLIWSLLSMEEILRSSF